MSDPGAISAELASQLAEQRAALADVEALLAADPSQELEQLRQELLEAVAYGQQSLLEVSQLPEDHQLSSHSEASSDSGTTSDAEGEDEALAVPANSESYAASGLGAALASDAQAVLQAAAAGPQTATAHFAEWESHTRGIGSALMAQMGYVSGSGLGMEGTGCVNPVHMQPLRTKAGLGNEASLADSAPHAKRKRKRGGERNARRKKAADHMQARSIAKDEEQATELTTGHAGIFAFINGNLGDSSVAAGELRRRHSSTSSEPVLKDWQLHMKQQKQRPPSSVQPQVAAGTAGSAPASDKAASQRQALASSQDTITALQQKVKHYTQMAARNAGDRTIHEQVKVKLKRAKDELAKAEASQIAAHSAIHAQEKQKKWMKF